jgi:hypothetical protein
MQQEREERENIFHLRERRNKTGQLVVLERGPLQFRTLRELGGQFSQLIVIHRQPHEVLQQTDLRWEL